MDQYVREHGLLSLDPCAVTCADDISQHQADGGLDTNNAKLELSQDCQKVVNGHDNGTKLLVCENLTDQPSVYLISGKHFWLGSFVSLWYPDRVECNFFVSSSMSMFYCNNDTG